MNRIANQQNCVIKEMDTNIGCFDGFRHHHLATMSVFKHVYSYHLFERAMKTCL